MLARSASLSSAYRVVRNAGVFLAAAGLLAFAVAIQAHIFQPSGTTAGASPVVNIADGSSVFGASSVVRRDNSGAKVTFKTAGLPAGHIVILKALIFNEPANCSHGSGSTRCGPDDLENNRTEPSVMYLTGLWLRGTTSAATFKASLPANDGGAAMVGAGLTNVFSAEIRLVLVDHGSPVAGLYTEMISTISGGCRDAAPGYGTPGPNTCTDIQYAVHDD